MRTVWILFIYLLFRWHLQIQNVSHLSWQHASKAAKSDGPVSEWRKCINNCTCCNHTSFWLWWNEAEGGTGRGAGLVLGQDTFPAKPKGMGSAPAGGSCPGIQAARRAEGQGKQELPFQGSRRLILNQKRTSPDIWQLGLEQKHPWNAAPLLSTALCPALLQLWEPRGAQGAALGLTGTEAPSAAPAWGWCLPSPVRATIKAQEMQSSRVHTQMFINSHL